MKEIDHKSKNYMDPKFRYENETFRPVKGADFAYDISNYGRVMCLPKRSWNGVGWKKHSTLIMRPFIDNGGYVSFKGKIRNEIIRIYPHRDVYKSFVGEIPEGYVIDHIDRNIRNNHISNIRIATRSQNSMNSHRGGFKGTWKRKDKNRNKLWVAEIRVMGNKRSLGCYFTQEEAARAYDKACLELHGDFALTNEMLGNFTSNP